MLQGAHFRPSFSYRLSLRSLFCLFLSGHFTQVLRYAQRNKKRRFTPTGEAWIFNLGGEVGSKKVFFTEGRAANPWEAIWPQESNCFSRVSVSVLLRAHEATCDFTGGGGVPPLTPLMDCFYLTRLGLHYLSMRHKVLVLTHKGVKSTDVLKHCYHLAHPLWFHWWLLREVKLKTPSEDC